MSYLAETIKTECPDADQASTLSEEVPNDDPLQMRLQDFVAECGEDLQDSLNRSNPPVYAGVARANRQVVLAQLKRLLFPAQAEAVHAMTELLINRDERAAILNGEMGVGKTCVGIAVAAVLRAEGYKRTLVISPPHLVYKWRREILETVAGAKVVILNGPDTLSKLLTLRAQLKTKTTPREHTFYILGRVRMRMGFHWRPAFVRHRDRELGEVAFCPDCHKCITDPDGNPVSAALIETDEHRRKCPHCQAPLWTLMRPKTLSKDAQASAVLKSLQRIPTIGEVRARHLIAQFGPDFLANRLGDNVHDFLNLMDKEGEFVFTDRQAARMERAMTNLEFGFGEGGYQASEYIKRYLPQGTFDLLIADEAHEYKNPNSAQGQAFGVLAAKARKTLLLTGTLIGGYADDLFYLLFRALPGRMVEGGYRPRRKLSSAAMDFMRDHGVLRDVYTESDSRSHKTAKGTKTTVRTVKAPGFGPRGVVDWVLPFTGFLKLKDIGGALPPYEEIFRAVEMTPSQAAVYQTLMLTLTSELKLALARKDSTLLGVVLNVLLAWPDCCFRPENVVHPRTRALLAWTPAQFGALEVMPKEREMIDICRSEHAAGRKTLVYAVYSGKRDTTTRLKVLLEQEGLKVAVLRASVNASRREDWIADQLDRGIDVLITNPELVKTGLDLLAFPTIVFMQTGYNVYTLQQASRRSWRIGQKQPVKVIFPGYANTAQIGCLELMSKKISVSQSTSGDVPDSGLDVLNQDGDSVEVALARQLVREQARY